MKLVDHFESGLDAPICLTWELTYACNLACVHCLSSSGRRDPRELSTAECKAVIDELERMQVFYVNIGGGEPTVRRDFWELVEYATAHHVGVKFSTNGSRIDAERAEWLRGSDYVDVQISLDGATADGQRPRARRRLVRRRRCAAMEHARRDGLQAERRRHARERGAARRLQGDRGPRSARQLRLTRLRPSGRGADVWDELHPTAGAAARGLRLAAGARRGGADRRLVLPPRRVRPVAAGPEPVRRGARRVPDRPGRRRLRLPVRDPRDVPRRQRAREAGFAHVWRESELFRVAARAAGGRRVRELRDVRRLPRRLHGGEVLHRAAARRARPRVRARPRRDGARDGARRASRRSTTRRRRAMVPVDDRRGPDESPV